MLNNEPNPWSKIPKNKTAIPVFTDPDIKRIFLWAYDQDKNPCLLLEIKDSRTKIPEKNMFPSLRGVLITDLINVRKYIIIRLLEVQQLDIFSEFCWLLINASVSQETEQETLKVLLKRCWRWHNLLSGARSTKLRPNEQKGLIGELYFLSEFLFDSTNVTMDMAVESWQGPLGGSKDFDLNKIQVEIKARRSGAKPLISISSEDQLEINLYSKLFLAVFGIDYSDSTKSRNLTEWCEYVEKKIEDENPNLITIFQNLLNEYGFNWDDDYTDASWEIQEIIYYQISESFPRIVGSQLSAGIENVKYSLDMNQLKDYEIEKSLLISSINEN